MALSTIKKILRDNRVVVLGSAPLSEEARKILASNENYKLICVNGAISSTSRIPDIWSVNSHEYDHPIQSNEFYWPPERKQLHEAMMMQAANRKIRHILFILKGRSPDQTISRLKQAGVKWRGSTTLHTGQRTDLARMAGVKKFVTAFNTSAGLFAASLALTCKASHVTLCGFSFSDGYAYLKDIPQNSRMHIEQDQEAIQDLNNVHGNRFTIIYSPLTTLLASTKA